MFYNPFLYPAAFFFPPVQLPLSPNHPPSPNDSQYLYKQHLREATLTPERDEPMIELSSTSSSPPSSSSSPDHLLQTDDEMPLNLSTKESNTSSSSVKQSPRHRNHYSSISGTPPPATITPTNLLMAHNSPKSSTKNLSIWSPAVMCEEKTSNTVITSASSSPASTSMTCGPIPSSNNNNNFLFGSMKFRSNFNRRREIKFEHLYFNRNDMNHHHQLSSHPLHHQQNHHKFLYANVGENGLLGHHDFMRDSDLLTRPDSTAQSESEKDMFMEDGRKRDRNYQVSDLFLFVT